MNQQSARARSRWSLVALLAALIAYLGSLALTGFAITLFFLAVTLVLIGVGLVAGAGVTGIRVGDRNRQPVLEWSLWSLALLVSAVIILLGTYGFVIAPACRAGCLDLTRQAGIIVVLIIVLGATGILFAFGAGIAGVVSSARAGETGWCVAMLTYQIGSVLGAIFGYAHFGQRFVPRDTLDVLLLLLPLLTPIVTLIYSLTGPSPSPR
jgi:hypothetical protein